LWVIESRFGRLPCFCVGGGKDADVEFREVLNQELFRRGILKTPEFNLANVNVSEFTDDDMESIYIWFDSDPEEPTLEDNYVELFTGRDRWKERNRKRRAAKEIT